MVSGLPGHAQLLTLQRGFFESGATRPLAARLAALKRLEESLRHHEEAILEALERDLGKPPSEAYSSEIGVLYLELRYARRRLARWLRPKRASWDLLHFPGRAEVRREPFGVALIIGPWNYPVQLLLAPLIGALAAGNVVVLKPSEISSHSEALVRRIVEHAFAPEWVSVVEGDAATTRALLQQRFDKIFFTGSTRVGRKVMLAAAQHLTPVTLELGGKCPAVVANDANIALAARRIVWGKFLNAGQTCVAPDFVVVPKARQSDMLHALRSEVRRRFGDDPSQSPHYGRLVSRDHGARLVELLQGANIAHGGRFDLDQRYLEPTLLDAPDWDAQVMREEIFGPILPVVPFDDEGELLERLAQRPKPLALYLFTRDRARIERVRTALQVGGMVVNGTLQHIVSPRLPFGGVGESGLGSYRGAASFEAFSRPRSELHLPASWPWSMGDVRQPPPLSWMRRFFG